MQSFDFVEMLMVLSVSVPVALSAMVAFEQYLSRKNSYAIAWSMSAARSKANVKRNLTVVGTRIEKLAA